MVDKKYLLILIERFCLNQTFLKLNRNSSTFFKKLIYLDICTIFQLPYKKYIQSLIVEVMCECIFFAISSQ